MQESFWLQKTGGHRGCTFPEISIFIKSTCLMISQGEEATREKNQFSHTHTHRMNNNDFVIHYHEILITEREKKKTFTPTQTYTQIINK